MPVVKTWLAKRSIIAASSPDSLSNRVHHSTKLPLMVVTGVTRRVA